MLKLDKNLKVDLPNRTPINEIPLKELDLTNKSDWDPKPGMMGTEYVGSDRYAVVCVDNLTPKRILLKRLHEFDENNIYNQSNISVDEDGVMWYEDFHKIDKKKCETYSKRKKGEWRKLVKTGQYGYSSPVYFGSAQPYRDPSF